MPVGGETIVAGPYTVTWNSVALGIQEGDSGLPTNEHQSEAEPVGNTSAYGKTVIDDIYQGANWFASMTCLEYKAGPIAAFWPFSAVLGRLGTVGVLLYGLAQPLVYTVVAGTTATPTTLTAAKTILLPRFVPRILHGPTLKKVPLRFRVYPYSSGGNTVFFTET